MEDGHPTDLSPVPLPDLEWTAKEVIRELYGTPHLLVRVTLTGTYFVGSAPELFVRIGGARSRFALVDDEGASVQAYFDTDPPDRPVDLGSGRRVMLRFPSFNAHRIQRLDRERLAPETVLP